MPEAAPEPGDVYCLTEQAAERIGVNRLTIQRWVAAGRLRGWRVGGVTLISREDVESEMIRRLSDS